MNIFNIGNSIRIIGIAKWKLHFFFCGRCCTTPTTSTTTLIPSPHFQGIFRRQYGVAKISCLNIYGLSVLVVKKKNQTNKKKQWFLPKLDHFPWVKFTFKFKFNIVNLSFQHLTCLILKDSWGFFYFKRLLLTGTLFWVWIPTGLFQNWAISSSVLFFFISLHSCWKCTLKKL